MSTPFLSSEEYDERAHQLYNEGQYDDALDVLREGLALYPNAVELRIGAGYARLAREEYAWARRAFEEALILDPDHEDALAGLGEVLLKLGERDGARRTFRRLLELGYEDDVELMLQAGRALFRDTLVEDARQFFETAVQYAPEMAEAVALLGYAQHRQGEDDVAIATLRRALQLDAEHTEARIYLGNVLYDRGDYEAALYHLERTKPEDHWDELGIWRLIELRKTIRGATDADPELRPWESRLVELGGEPNDIDDLLAEIEARALEDNPDANAQLELFGAMLADLTESQRSAQAHRIATGDGREFAGTWDEILRGMRDASPVSGRSVHDFMVTEARREYARTGILIATRDAESFLRGSADAGLLRIIR